MKVRLHPEAVEDLLSAGDWYESQRPGLGRDLLEEVDRALTLIAENPSAWPRLPGSAQELAIRAFVLVRFPFSLPYLIGTDEVVVLAVAHEKRRPGYWLNRVSQNR